eukprot:364779-Chlamydomonas_euryale.AAC.2
MRGCVRYMDLGLRLPHGSNRCCSKPLPSALLLYPTTTPPPNHAPPSSATPAAHQHVSRLAPPLSHRPGECRCRGARSEHRRALVVCGRRKAADEQQRRHV